MDHQQESPGSDAAAPATPIARPSSSIWLASPWPLLLSLCALSGLFVCLLGDPAEILEMRWLGQVLRWRYERGAAPAVDPHIVHLDIGRQDLENMPSLESEYQKAADIIRLTTALGARVVAFDVVFGRGTEAMTLPIIEEVKRAAAENRTVVFAEALLPSPDNSGTQRIRSFPRMERQRPAGLINVQADSDGIFRRYALANPADKSYEPSLALSAYLAWKQVDAEKDVTSPRLGILRWEELDQDFTSKPYDLEAGPKLLNMRAPWTGSGPAAFRHITVARLEELERERAQANTKPLDEAIVFVSYTGTGLGDVGTTALAANQPRVTLHSSALNDFIQHSWLRRSGRLVDLLGIGLVLLLGSIARFCRGTIPLLAFWATAVLAIAVSSIFLIVREGWVVASVFPAVTWTIVTGAEIGRRYGNELVERLKLRATMGLYFSPRVMERVLKNPGSMEPQEAELTVLLTDIRNSTPIAELAGARGTFALLNQVFEAQTAAIMAEDGSLEHFLGDQFLSYWGAPDAQPDSADRAYRAALALITGMEHVRTTLTPEMRKLFGYGVALHTGMALIGNKGSAQRLDYGLVGDLINAAARVESLTKYYGVLFLMTHETYAKLSTPPPTRVIDDVIVKGRSTSLRLHEVQHPFSPPDFETLTPAYNLAFERYRAGDFADAKSKFAVLGEGGDRPSKLMADRCTELAEVCPAEWDGIYELKNK